MYPTVQSLPKRFSEKLNSSPITNILSLPTKSCQILGFLPFTFDPATNSLTFQFLSISSLSFILQFILNSIWSVFCVLNNRSLFDVVNPERKTGTVTFTYKTVMFLSPIITNLIRISIFLQRKQILQFYQRFQLTLSQITSHYYHHHHFKSSSDSNTNAFLHISPLCLDQSIIKSSKSKIRFAFLIIFSALLVQFATHFFIAILIYNSNLSLFQNVWLKSFGIFGVVFSSIPNAFFLL